MWWWEFRECWFFHPCCANSSWFKCHYQIICLLVQQKLIELIICARYHSGSRITAVKHFTNVLLHALADKMDIRQVSNWCCRVSDGWKGSGEILSRNGAWGVRRMNTAVEQMGRQDLIEKKYLNKHQRRVKSWLWVFAEEYPKQKRENAKAGACR